MNTVHTLPEKTATELIALRESDTDLFYVAIKALTDHKWSLRSIAEAIGVSFTSVQKWKTLADTEHYALTIEVPEVPERFKATSSKPTKPEVHIPSSDQNRIQELIPLAAMVRGRTPQDSPYREAARELEDILFKYKEQDVSYKTLSALAGVSRRAIAQRLESRARRVGTTT
jgi:hypothetical protein